MNNARVTAAARAMRQHFAEEAGANVDTMWEQRKHMLIADAKVALAAADAVPGQAPAPPKPRKKHEMLKAQTIMQASTILWLLLDKQTLEATVHAYRERYGVLGTTH